MRMGLLQQKKIILTGASKGLGAVCAKSLAREGAQLVLMARTEEKLEALRKSCQNPEHHLSLAGDLTDFAQLRHSIEKAQQFLGEVDAVVHIAGGGLGLKNNLLSAEDFEKLFALNVKVISLLPQ